MKPGDGAAGSSAELSFGPAVDRWLLLVVGLVLLSMLGSFRALWSEGGWAFALFLLLSLAVMGLVLLLTVPLRYTVDSEAVRVRAGFMRFRWALADVVRMETAVGLVSSPTAGWTVHRVRLFDRNGRVLVLGPADRDGFVAAVLARAPHLVAEPRGVEAKRTLWRDPSRDRWGRGA